VIIEKIQVMYLAGKKVDYDEVEGEIGFVFRDAN
jgi:Fe-S cluster assembly iron-binding protein IscA